MTALLVFHNPAAGASWLAFRTRQALSLLRGRSDARVVETRPGAIPAQVRAELTPDVHTVVAVGGDGTVCDVAAGLEDAHASLGIVPSGTTNVLAREFGVPLDPRRAVALLQGLTATRSIRLWAAGDRRLVLGAGVGWDARLMHRASPTMKRHFGMGALMPLAGALAVAYDFPQLTVTGLDVAGTTVRLDGTSVIAANARFWSGANAAIPMADPADDLLEIVVLEPARIGHLLRFWMGMMLPGARPLQLRGVRTARLRELSIMSASAAGTEVHINGEPAGRTPVTLRPAGTVRVRVTAR